MHLCNVVCDLLSGQRQNLGKRRMDTDCTVETDIRLVAFRFVYGSRIVFYRIFGSGRINSKQYNKCIRNDRAQARSFCSVTAIGYESVRVHMMGYWDSNRIHIAGLIPIRLYL